MRNPKGQFIKGVRSSPKTQFQRGQHWRKRKPYWDRDWLEREYVINIRSARDIANQFSLHSNAILFWIKKHKIPTRSTSQVRALKKWGASGPANPMYGKRGILCPHWKGGLTPLRQRIYASSQWASLRRAVYKRDKCCRLCQSGGRLEIHHIDKFSEAPLLMLDIGNVILLCHKCHLQMRGKEKRWKKKLFRLLQKELDQNVTTS